MTRAEGTCIPLGNPHYWLTRKTAAHRKGHADKLSEMGPETRRTSRQRFTDFAQRLKQADQRG